MVNILIWEVHFKAESLVLFFKTKFTKSSQANHSKMTEFTEINIHQEIWCKCKKKNTLRFKKCLFCLLTGVINCILKPLNLNFVSDVTRKIMTIMHNYANSGLINSIISYFMVGFTWKIYKGNNLFVSCLGERSCVKCLMIIYPYLYNRSSVTTNKQSDMYKLVDKSLNVCRGDSVLTLSPHAIPTRSPWFLGHWRCSRETAGLCETTALMTRELVVFNQQLRTKAVILREQYSIVEAWIITSPPWLNYLTATDH